MYVILVQTETSVRVVGTRAGEPYPTRTTPDRRAAQLVAAGERAVVVPVEWYDREED